MMLVPEGTNATTQEVRARWAYGEMSSDRFGPKYRAHSISKAILDCADNHAVFEDVDKSCWAELDDLLDLARPGEYLHDSLKQWQSFECAYWSKADFATVLAIPAFNKARGRPFPYMDFYNGLPDTGVKQGILGFAEDSDPRVQAFRRSFGCITGVRRAHLPGHHPQAGGRDTGSRSTADDSAPT